jgi:hypothetical protein
MLWNAILNWQAILRRSVAGPVPVNDSAKTP